MKNNIKYAGIAAAALLAVAPIAAPVLTTTNTQVAQAATSSITADQQKAVDQLFSMFNDVNYESSADVPTFTSILNNYGKDNAVTYSALTAMPFMNKVLDNKVLGTDYTNKINDAGVTFGLVGYKNGKALSSSEFQLSINDLKTNKLPMSIQITAYDKDGNALDGSQSVINFTNSGVVTEAPTALNLTFTDPMDVAVNSTTSAPKYSSSVDPEVVDQNGNDIDITSATPSQNLYTSADAALADNGKNTFTDSTFKTAGNTYYQPVTVLLKDTTLVNKIGPNYQNGKEGYTITLNGGKAITANYDTKAGTLTYVRSIVVGNAVTDGDWVTTPSKGVVTVKSSLAHLYNDDNKMTTRSLAPASGWQTDSYRTNSKTGQKQWHVSTHEWVNDTDVTFDDGTVTGDGLGNFQNFDMKILTLDGPAGFVYTLFKADGTNATRGLAGLTAWQTDRSATDAAGNTYYRVSTDEWVRMGSGVTVK
ncbi:hypothetical protein [Companilactobacillus mishanensis]|uniref:Surface layer protein A domain-containing protein n=1 Tax=Companilactobacillus mishanensis TaxID=2486008 RepID=A0A5P0ZL73_9LACO|nr:hypothetical protein [Companilactobacillus mishanensis]MQS53417.1 hypothetical protein [Companilactobacillus mishanensis]